MRAAIDPLLRARLHQLINTPPYELVARALAAAVPSAGFGLEHIQCHCNARVHARRHQVRGLDSSNARACPSRGGCRRSLRHGATVGINRMTALLGGLVMLRVAAVELAAQVQPNILMIVADGAFNLPCAVAGRAAGSLQPCVVCGPGRPRVSSCLRSNAVRNQISATTTWDTTNPRLALPNRTRQTHEAKPRLTPRLESCRLRRLTSSHLKGQSWRCTTCSHCARRRVLLS